MGQIYQDVRHTRAAPGRSSWRTLLGYTFLGREVARKFRNEIRALPADTDVDRRAMNYLVPNAGFAYQTMTDEERRVRRLRRNLTLVQSIRALDKLEFALASAHLQISTVMGTALQLMPELIEPFHETKSCKELDALLEEASTQ